MAGWPPPATRGIQVGWPGGCRGTSLWPAEQQKCSDAKCAVAGTRQSSRTGWLVSSCSHPACHTSRSFRYLGEDVGDGRSFGVSSVEGFPPGIRIWPPWLRMVSQSDQTASDFSLALILPPPFLQVTFSIRCGRQAPALTLQLTPEAQPSLHVPAGFSSSPFNAGWVWLQMIGRNL